MFERTTTDRLLEEIGHYLAAVDLFRALECEPTWRAELAPEQTPSTSATPRVSASDISLH